MATTREHATIARTSSRARAAPRRHGASVVARVIVRADGRARDRGPRRRRAAARRPRPHRADARRRGAPRVEAGHAVLAPGGSALDAVEAAVVVLEDDPEFNAGRGAALTEDGGVELDAVVMEGTGRCAGAVACVAGVRNPVRAARAVLEDGHHVLLVGDGARARSPPSAASSSATTAGSSPTASARCSRPARTAGRHGTVGAVARDARRPPRRRDLDRRHDGPAPRPGRRLPADRRRHLGRRRQRRRLLHRRRRGDHPRRDGARGRRARPARAARSLEQACAEALALLERRGGHGGLIAVSAARRGHRPLQLARHDPRLAGRRRARPHGRRCRLTPSRRRRTASTACRSTTSSASATRRAKELRKAGEKDAAAAVAKLPKPSQVAWVGQPARRARARRRAARGGRRAARGRSSAAAGARRCARPTAAERGAVEALVAAPTTYRRSRATARTACARSCTRSPATTSCASAFAAGRLVEEPEAGGWPTGAFTAVPRGVARQDQEEGAGQAPAEPRREAQARGAGAQGRGAGRAARGRAQARGGRAPQARAPPRDRPRARRRGQAPPRRRPGGLRGATHEVARIEEQLARRPSDVVHLPGARPRRRRGGAVGAAAQPPRSGVGAGQAAGSKPSSTRRPCAGARATRPSRPARRRAAPRAA